MVVPTAVIQVDETHPPFDQAPGQKTIGRVAAIARFGSIKLEGGGGFVGYIHQTWNARLHTEGHFVSGNPGIDFGVSPESVSLFIQLSDSAHKRRLGLG